MTLKLIVFFCFLALLGNASPILIDEFLFSSPPFESCHASTLTENKEGELLVAYFAGTHEQHSDVAIYLSKFKDKHWDKPEVVADAKDVPTWNPVLTTLPSGEILLFYKAGTSPLTWSGFLITSTDNGNSWSDPHILPAGVLGPIKNKPLLLSDGTLLCGSSVQSYEAWGCYVDRTKDRGKTWKKSNPINVDGHPEGIIQPTLFCGNRGTIQMLTRSRGIGYICSSKSYDWGRTWTPAIPTKLPNPNSGIDAVRIKDGRIFLVYNDSHTKRTPINLALSKDGGNHWEMILTLEEGEGSFSYPAIIQTADGLIHITYTWNRKNIKHLVLDPTLLH